jgi:membrane-associated phospholipid phosphatase
MLTSEAQSSPIQVSSRSEMTRRERLLWLFAVLALQALYFPINRFVSGGINLRIPVLDDLVPLWPAWVVPYLLSLVWWTACFLWAAWKMEGRLYRALACGAVVTVLASYVVYLVLPTYVVRPSLEGSGWTADLLRLVYTNDRIYNAFPSGHTYNAVLIALFWSRWQPRWRWLWGATAMITVLSALLTGQHQLLDPLGGMLFAWTGYRFGLWWAGRRDRGV